MKEKKIDITIESWNKIYKELPINHNNKGFFKLLNEIYSKLASNKAYAYYVDYKFGERIISNGNIPLANFCLKNTNNAFSKDNNNFKNDLNYSTDPLGIVSNNEAVIVSNSIRLGLLKQGQLLGVFGRLDYLNFDKSNIFGNKDWNVLSGDPSFHFIFSFTLVQNDLIIEKYLKAHCKTEKKGGKEYGPLIKIKGKYVYDENKSIIEKGIDLVNLLDVETSSTRIIYIPKHIFSEIYPVNLENQYLNLKMKNYIYQKGWEQSKPIRNALFEDGEINNLIRDIEDLYNKDSLIQLYVLCYHISRGEKESLMLLTNNDKTEKNIYNNFVSSNKVHFESSSSNHPLILKYKKIKTKNDFGVLSLNHLPIKNLNPFKKLALTIDSFEKIKEKLNHTFQVEFYNSKKTVRNCNNIHKNFIDELKKDTNIKEFKIPREEYDRLLIIRSSLQNTFPEYFVLNELKNEIKKYNTDFSNYYIISVQHLLRSTGSLFEALIDIGFNPSHIYLTGKIYSTHKETENLLKDDLGINIFESTKNEQLGDYSKGLKKDIEKMWTSLLKIVKPNSKIIVLDDGGYILKSVTKEILKKHVIYGIEQTTSGIKKRDDFESFPIIDVAASAAKVLLEPLLVSEAVNIQLHEKFMEFKPENIGIIGYGHIGKAIAQEYNEKGYNIFIFDDDESILKLDDSITQCKTAWELYEKSDIIIGSTGTDISNQKWITNSSGNKVFMSVSSGDIEFNNLISSNSFEDLDTQENKNKPAPLRIKVLKTEKNHTLTLLRGGMVSNFTGSADSSPGEYIQITRGLLFSAIIQIIKNGEDLDNTVIKLDAELQKKVVADWFTDQPQKKMDYREDVLSIFSKIDSINEKSGGK